MAVGTGRAMMITGVALSPLAENPDNMYQGSLKLINLMIMIISISSSYVNFQIKMMIMILAFSS